METPVAKAIIDVVKKCATEEQDKFVETVSDELIGIVMDAYGIGMDDGTSGAVKIIESSLGSVSLEEQSA